ncbi:MAG TPA: transposase, partial [Thermoleophilaceae bacterium]|nr:transposase [Thermoleophilaceae bacterium]
RWRRRRDLDRGEARCTRQRRHRAFDLGPGPVQLAPGEELARADPAAPGETVHGVARRRGVSTSQLFTWRKQLRAEAGLPPSPLTVPGFAAVAIAPVPPLAGDAAEAPSGLIEIELADGGRVRISGAADPAVVAAALRALAGR